MNNDKKRELLETLQSGNNKQFYKKYEIVEVFIGTVEREVDIFSTHNNDSREDQVWNGEYMYRVYEIYTGTIVYEGHFLDELELIEELEAELERYRGEYKMMRELLLTNMELEKEFKEINLDGAGELVKEMMLDLHWDLFTAVQQGEADYVVDSSNDYATTLLENQEQLIEALGKAETEFVKYMYMYERDSEIDEYVIKDISLEYLNLGLEFFEDMIN